MYDEIKSIEEAKVIIAEQDMMIGKLTREINWLKDSQMKHRDWNRKAKKDAGYNDSISFDIVWEETLEKSKKLAVLGEVIAEFMEKADEYIESHNEENVKKVLKKILDRVVGD